LVMPYAVLYHRAHCTVQCRVGVTCGNCQIGRDSAVALRRWQYGGMRTAGGILVPPESLASSARDLHATLNHVRYCMGLQLAATSRS
jgi:hypothetical protein